MATESGGGGDDIKSHFGTREGTYRHCPLSEYCKPNRSTYPELGNTPVSVSFANLGRKTETPDTICFNTGKELYVYAYKGLRKAADLTLHVDKKAYKGTFPTCHSFNEFVGNTDSVLLLVGFSAGQIQLSDPIKRDLNQLFNEERTIDKTKVTCISWIPNSPNQFIVSHASGCMYIYSRDSTCPIVGPSYQVFKQGDGHHMVYTCKTKSTRNPLFMWQIGEGAIYQFAFSPCKQNLAVVSQDGFLRVFDYNKMELLGHMKSYFGGLHCVSWSPDGKYLVCGGEDDLITVYSLYANRVICRGRGHRSWVTAVAFDPYTTSANAEDDGEYASDEDTTPNHVGEKTYNQGRLRASTRSTTSSRHSVRFDCDGNAIPFRTYRIGSVSQDTNLCLWDISSDVLHSHLSRHRTSSNIAHTFSDLGNTSSNSLHSPAPSTAPPSPNPIANGGKPRRNFTLGSKDKNTIRSNTVAAMHVKLSQVSLRMLGTQQCPKLNEVPLLEPLTCKKLAHSSLTSLFFFKDCLVASCQDGIISTYARPGHNILGVHHDPDSPVEEHARNGFEGSV